MGPPFHLPCTPFLDQLLLTAPTPMRHLHLGTPPLSICPHTPPSVPTLMWKDDRETLGLPVVQRKRSCWSARGSGSGEGFWPGLPGRMPSTPASFLWKAVQLSPT